METFKHQTMVRILSAKENSKADFIGMGFIIDKKHILTCAHNIMASIGAGDISDPNLTDVIIPIQFCGTNQGSTPETAKVVYFYPPSFDGDLCDISVLRFDNALYEKNNFAPLVDLMEVGQFSSSTCTYYVEFDTKESFGYGHGIVSHDLKHQRWQINHDPILGGITIKEGFSGTPSLVG